MSNTGNIDYDALAKKYGATSSTPAPAQGGIDYDALAKKNGAISSTTYHGVVPKEVLDNLRAKSAEPTQFEKDRNPDNQQGGLSSYGTELGNFVKAIPQMAKTVIDPVHSASEMGAEMGSNLIPDWQRRTQEGRSIPYKAVAAVAPMVGANVNKMEQQADVGNSRGIIGTALADATPAVVLPALEKFGPAVDKFAGSAVDKFKVAKDAGIKEAVFPNPAGKLPEAAGLPPKAVSGAEDFYRAAAPVGKNAGFRENVLIAAPDLADVARTVKLQEAKGGIINPDLRVRATVSALDDHLQTMYETERLPQIQAHADVPVKVGTSPDSVRALEYLETTAGTENVRALASKALGVEGTSGVRFAAKPLTLAEADTLAQAANKYLKSYERAPSDVQMQMQQTSPKVGGLKSLDTELGRSIDKVLTSNGETGIRDYERRFAAVSEARSQLRDRMNATELERQSLGKYVKVLTGGKEAIASASQAAVSSVNIGRKLQTAFQKLAESGITAKKRTLPTPSQ